MKQLLFLANFALWITATVHATTYPLGPNRFLGTCLDSAWVAQIEAEKGVSSQDRDSKGRLMHPFLQPALKYPRYRVDDPRTASGKAFTDSCIPSGRFFYGANQDPEGKNRGEVNGTLVLDLAAWDTHALSTMVLAIMAAEVSGYQVSISKGGPGVEITQRMSSVGSGICTPTHLNVEVWTSSTMSDLRVFFNETYQVGGVGYFGLSGVYTTHQFVLDGMNATSPYFPDFWKHYKTTACAKRESAGKTCLVMALMVPYYDQGYFQAVFDNLDIPAYFCFIGYGGVNNFASDAAKSGAPILFYHYEPDLFHVTHKGKFDRVALPRTDAERVKLSTGTYGENGFGVKTNNLVDVDYPSLLLSKFAEPYFRAACNWVKANYDVWSDWHDRLPLCAFEANIVSQVTGCENGSYREIQFSWNQPNPGNNSLPNDCDGGVTTLPVSIITSRSCDWIYSNQRTWAGWIDTKPVCDSTFYDYKVSECDSDAYRTVRYFWKLPNISNSSSSAECSGGENLPDDVIIDCEYMPTSSTTFQTLAALAAIVAVLLLIASVIVFKQRNAPVIRRSQFEMLLLMIFGGFFTTGAAVAYAGRPTQLLCGIRPVLVCMGFTTIFGALVMKSLRVYRVFMKSAMKRVKVTLFRILKILSIFYIGDIIIFIGWFAADFPEPTIKHDEASEFRGTVDRISCHSSSFIFTALLIFWKAILLILGLYLSFLIRNVSVDFQESPWIFGSVVVVLVGCVLILPMSYLVQIRAATYYVFLACTLIICTVVIMGFMLVPKLFRLKEVGSSSTGSNMSSTSVRSRKSYVQANTTENDTTVITYQVKPVYMAPPTRNDSVSETTRTTD
ncbi:G-protein coupled receptor [Phytophthora megakarya]|uniref:G-protein coupled receptor n=1 Tax=Phytophthora megakarya TaxID=4795 RepID=A0A225X2X4_9STRA|nr:G-protein coupled receptor [Phytophthora megakarya]